MAQISLFLISKNMERISHAWSLNFHDFVAKCQTKEPRRCLAASEMLKQMPLPPSIRQRLISSTLMNLAQALAYHKIRRGPHDFQLIVGGFDAL
ncbi:serine/threonine-protein kinase dst1 [Trifolium repens]|nr:serine/threonine-protein kinase dst1 [Trifolium repens]